MTEPIYLNSLEIQNFRPFKRAQVAIPGPGVLILAGPNGLGKSSFFDAIEWGLTGSVKRLRPSTGALDHLCARRTREGSTSERFHVALSYSGGHEIERNARIRSGTNEYEISTSTCVSSVLRSSGWTIDIPAEAISTYLHQTHIFLQTPSGRFVSRGAQDRWRDIEGPAGVQRMMAIQRSLGPPTKTGLTKRMAQLRDELESEQAQLQNWRGLLKRRDTLRAQVGGGGGLDRGQAEAEIRALEMSLEIAAGEDETLEGRLRNLFLRIQAVELEIARERDILHEGREIVRTYEDLRDAANAVTLQCEGAAKSLQQEMERLSAFRVKHEQCCRTAEELQARLAAHDTRVEQIVAVHRARALSKEMGKHVSSVRQQLDDAVSGLKDVRAEQRTTLQAIAQVQQLKRQIEELWGRRREILDARNSARRLSDRIVVCGNLAQQRERLVESMRECEDVLNDEKDACSEQEEVLETAKHHLAVEARRRNAIVGAVSTIIANIDRDTCLCPACGATYTRQELERRLQESIEGGGEELLRLERCVHQEEVSLTEIRDRIDLKEVEIARTREQILQIDNQTQDIEAAHVALLSAPLFAGVPRGDLEHAVRHLTVALEDVDREIENVSSSVDRLDGAELVIRSESLGNRESELAGLEAQLRRELARLESQLSVSDAVIRRSDFGSDSDALLAKAAGDREHLREDWQLAIVQKDEMLVACSSTESQVGEWHARMATLQDRLGSMRRQQDDLARRWAHLGFSGDVLNEAQREREVRHRERQPAVSLGRLRHRQISEGYARWLAESQLAEAEAEIERWMARGKADSQSSVTQHLSRHVEASERNFETARRVVQGVTWLDRRVKDEMDRYVPGILNPLNSVAEEILEALSVSTGQRVQMQAPRKGSSYPVSLRVLGDFAGNASAISPEEMLSEGQLAFVSLGITVAMSLIYRWSDWRCLLLDDPFQNNDIVRISALLDVLRGLVLERQYQIILSTHDLGLADFLHRKFLAGGVSVSLCQMGAATDDGVVLSHD